MSEKKIPETLNFKCDKCPRVFSTTRGRASHQKAHPYIPPPRSTTEKLPVQIFLEEHSLQNGKHLELGDVFYRVEKHVIKSITKTEGTTTVKVGTEKLRSNWQSNQPQ